jgi:hypothetical protein
MSKQPAFARDLIERFVEAIVKGKATYHIPVDQMEPDKQLWLEKHFDMEYDEDIHEYKINLI